MIGALPLLRDASEKYARAIARRTADGSWTITHTARHTPWTQFLDEDTIEEADATSPDL